MYTTNVIIKPKATLTETIKSRVPRDFHNIDEETNALHIQFSGNHHNNNTLVSHKLLASKMKMNSQEPVYTYSHNTTERSSWKETTCHKPYSVKVKDRSFVTTSPERMVGLPNQHQYQTQQDLTAAFSKLLPLSRSFLSRTLSQCSAW